jgi:hypothetical protein
MDTSSSGKFIHQSGQVIHNKEREIICNVVVCCDKEAKDMELSVPIQKAMTSPRKQK